MILGGFSGDDLRFAWPSSPNSQFVFEKIFGFYFSKANCSPKA